MTLLADISTGNTGFADVCFLIGFILAVIAALVAAPIGGPGEARPWTSTLGLFALAAVALGWLVS